MEEEIKDIVIKNTPLSFILPVDLTAPLSVRYKQASLQVLENIRTLGSMKLEPTLAHYGCALSENPSEEELADYRKFIEDIYPAVPRLKDLRMKTLEAIHKRSDLFGSETLTNLTQLLKTLDHDIDTAEGNEVGRTTNNVFIFNNDQAQRIAARLSGRDGKTDSYAVEE